MRPTIEGDVGSNQSPGSDGDLARIQNGCIEVDEDALADLHIGAVVYVYRWLDPGIIGKELFVLLLRSGWWW